MRWQRFRLLCQPSHYFPRLKRLEHTLDALLEKEEIFWQQRSKVSWLKYGDCNTRFFHMSEQNLVPVIIPLMVSWMNMGTIEPMRKKLVNYFVLFTVLCLLKQVT